jgi:hypothetical protein
MEKDYNFKKLLCYNIVNNNECLYKSKCMFAHNINEQKKEVIREYVYDIINVIDDISVIDIYDDKNLLNELLIYTKECKNCINKKCPGGYNCKFGACLRDLRICYNDLLYGKCFNCLKEDISLEGKTIKRCINGIHLTEKKLIPYQQRINGEINLSELSIFFNEYDLGKNNKFNTISLILNDNTIKKVKYLINYNKKNENLNFKLNNDLLNNDLLNDDNSSEGNKSNDNDIYDELFTSDEDKISIKNKIEIEIENKNDIENDDISFQNNNIFIVNPKNKINNINDEITELLLNN